ncbi:SGNH/GDSL hydrolase family protein [Bacillus infantis]|uniref:SGNH/GDSL hydrolase family protein n=1 Tax=Bacillus infantis TaxID=324767 RepID=UPI001CD77815|nr:SGNH/GDSL hydrolase family protein [Bacillus infantis]MCA1039942.1 SGNH/GDSL hydrolase family protein [Bacillus infantis]
MKKTFTLLVLAAFFLSSCSGAGDSSPKNLGMKDIGIFEKEMVPNDFIPRDIHVVSVGDSLTEGVGDSTGRGGYLPYLQEQLEQEKGVAQTEFLNFGVKGNRTDQLLKKLRSSEVRSAISDADLVIITIGGNDVMKVVRQNFSNLNVSDFKGQKAQYEENLKEIIDTVRSENSDTQIALIGLYNPFYKWFSDITEISDIMDNWNEASRKILSSYDYTYFVDIKDIFENKAEDLLYTDYFHPNDKGYELIADRVYRQIGRETLEVIAEQQKYAARNEES